MDISPADQENVDLLCGRGFLFLLGIFSQLGQVECADLGGGQLDLSDPVGAEGDRSALHVLEEPGKPGSCAEVGDIVFRPLAEKVVAKSRPLGFVRKGMPEKEEAKRFSAGAPGRWRGLQPSGSLHPARARSKAGFPRNDHHC